jgi:hypothetical protein
MANGELNCCDAMGLKASRLRYSTGAGRTDGSTLNQQQRMMILARHQRILNDMKFNILEDLSWVQSVELVDVVLANSEEERSSIPELSLTAAGRCGNGRNQSGANQSRPVTSIKQSMQIKLSNCIEGMKSKLKSNYDLTTVVGPVAVVVTTEMTVLARPSGKSRATSS